MTSNISYLIHGGIEDHIRRQRKARQRKNEIVQKVKKMSGNNYPHGRSPKNFEKLNCYFRAIFQQGGLFRVPQMIKYLYFSSLESNPRLENKKIRVTVPEVNKLSYLTRSSKRKNIVKKTAVINQQKKNQKELRGIIRSYGQKIVTNKKNYKQAQSLLRAELNSVEFKLPDFED